MGGIQPKKVVLDQTPRTCPACSLPSARRVRLDHYFSLFFIPLFRVKRGDEFLECSRCGVVGRGGWPGSPAPSPQPGRRELPRRCRSCGRELEPEFVFCPYCGQRR